MNKNNHPDISNIVDLEKTMMTKAADELLLIKNELQLENKQLKEKLNEADQKIFHLEKLLKALPKVTQVGASFHVTDEESIAELQLKRLATLAMERELTLEEVKKYDILVKNKRLASDKSTINANHVNLEKATDEDLMLIASGKINE